MNQSTLMRAGLRTTLPRRLILEVLEKSPQRHLGAEDIYRALQESGEEVGIATVYRVLTQFEQSGLVLRHRFVSDKAIYELNDESHHDHMVCVECGNVYEFVDSEIEQKQKDIADLAGFVLQDHSLQLYGVCQGMKDHGKCSMEPETTMGILEIDSKKTNPN